MDPVKDNLIACAEALFVSDLDPSGQPSDEQIRTAIRDMRWGPASLPRRERLARRAQAYGENQESAAARMRWALAATSRVLHVAEAGRG